MRTMLVILLLLVSWSAVADEDINDTYAFAGMPVGGHVVFFVGSRAPYNVSVNPTGGTCRIETTPSTSPSKATAPLPIWTAWPAGDAAVATTAALYAPVNGVRIVLSAGTCVVNVAGSKP